MILCVNCERIISHRTIPLSFVFPFAFGDKIVFENVVLSCLRDFKLISSVFEFVSH